MLRTSLLLVAALATTAAAPKPARKPAAPAASAAKPAPPQGAAFDSGDPANLVALLNAAGAKAQVARKDADAVLVTVASAAANFSMQFAECSAQGVACKAAVLDSQAEGAPSAVQINAFNQTSAMCRGYADRSGKAHVVMSMLLFPDDTRQHVVTAMAAWQGCLADFTGFAKNPVAYLSAAP